MSRVYSKAELQEEKAKSRAKLQKEKRKQRPGCPYLVTRGSRKGKPCNKSLQYKGFCSQEHFEAHHAHQAGLTVSQYKQKQDDDFVARYGMTRQEHEKQQIEIAAKAYRDMKEKEEKAQQDQILQELKTNPRHHVELVEKNINDDMFREVFLADQYLADVDFDHQVVKLLDGKQYRLGLIEILQKN